MIDFQNFIGLVKDMRAAQKDYFRTRSKQSLSKAKDLEAKVDRLLGGMQA